MLVGEIQEFKVYGFSSSYYTSDYKGSACEINANVKISDAKYNVTSVMVKNDDGYGIYSFEIEKDD